MILYRCFAWNRDARNDAADGPLWFPRIFQGDGRHDNPDVYGCLYLADRAVSCIVEQLAPFRGQRSPPHCCGAAAFHLPSPRLSWTVLHRSSTSMIRPYSLANA